tara:strand:- start:7120 stop:8181 length:1062 start_codon:yes stop_codon:yes gene_type:complete
MPKVAIIPGDGVGPEVMTEAVKLIDTLNERFQLSLETIQFDLGAEYYLSDGISVPDSVIQEIKKNVDAILIGCLGDPRIPDNIHINEIYNTFFRKFNLFCESIHIELLNEDLGILMNKTPNDINFIIVREIHEILGKQYGRQYYKNSKSEITVDEIVSSKQHVFNIIDHTFKMATRWKRSMVTLTTMPEESPYSHGLWLRSFDEIKSNYTDISATHIRYPHLIFQLLREPEKFDIIVVNSGLGRLLSDIGLSLTGGYGLGCSTIYSPSDFILLRPLHPSSTKFAGKDYANPLAVMLCVVSLLKHLKKGKIAESVESAIKKSVESGWVTRDLGGSLGTEEVGDFICSNIVEADK